jgi:L1 cell adhesion molecule like protein
MWPFKVISGPSDRPLIVVQYRGEEKQFTAEEILAMVLVKMREAAEAYLEKEVRNAVITVPAYFNDSQRQATIDSATIAGLYVMRIINEPSAAVVAHGLDMISDGDGAKSVLVFDLGGGSLDVSIIKLSPGVHADATTCEFMSVAGDTHLGVGGEDLDTGTVEHFVKDFLWRYKRDIRSNPRALMRLRTACERAKWMLSSTAQASFQILSLHDGIDFYGTLTRAKFEELNADFFCKCMEYVENCLREAKMDRSQINDVVLVGGSTRVPKLQQLLQDFFSGKKPICCHDSANPDEIVAYGAAIQAAVLETSAARATCRSAPDVVTFSLGIETVGGAMDVLIPRDTKIPVRRQAVYTTHFNDQTGVRIKVYEGEAPLTEDKNLLGEFWLTGIPPAPKGVPRVNVITFEIGASWVLKVSAEDMTTGNKKSITISNQKGRLSREIDRIVHGANRYKPKELTNKKQMKKVKKERGCP